MKFPRLASFVFFAVSLSIAQTNPHPLVYPSLIPTSVQPGGSGFSLTVGGFGFVAGSIVEWNGSPRATMFVSPSSVQAAITAADIATAGTALISVLNPAPGGGISNSVNFSVTTPEASVSVALDSTLYNTDPEGGPYLLVADFNGDGIPDIVASGPASTLAFYQGNGDGTFKPPVSSTTNVDGPIFGPADFNGDGRPDIIITGYPSDEGFSEVSFVFLNNGDGTFSQQAPIRSGSDYGGPVAAADFAGNGKLDLLYESCVQGSCNINYLSGNGRGGFGNSHYIEPLQNFYGGAAVGDFNGDGKLDFAIAGPPLYIFLGEGNGMFKAPTTIPAVTGPDLAPAVDLNGDGKLDLVADNRNVGLCVLLGNGDGTFDTNCSGTDQYYSPLYLADFNGDGKLDLAANTIGAQAFTGQIEVQLGNGDGTFQPPSAAAGYSYESGIGDFNGDGKIDFAGSGPTGISIFLQSPAALTPLSLTFGTYEEGTTSPPQTVTLSNNGSTALKVGATALGGVNLGDFLVNNPCKVIQPGSSCSFKVAFKPTGPNYRAATLTVNYGTSPKTSQTIQLTGTGQTTNASFSPTSLNYGIVVIGQTSAAMSSTLTNSGPGLLTISGFTLTGAFILTNNNCGATLAVGASCQVSAAFTPIVSGSQSGQIMANTNAQNAAPIVTLSGTASNLLVSPLSLNFGNQSVGSTSAPMAVTLTNVTNSPVQVIPITITGKNHADFAETNNCGNELSPGASCTLNVTFTPKATGARSATLTPDSEQSTQPVALSGTGT